MSTVVLAIVMKFPVVSQSELNFESNTQPVQLPQAPHVP